MSRDLSIPHDELRDPQTVTQRVAQEFAAHDLSVHVHEAVTVDDDDKKQVRHIRVKTPTTMVFMPEAPWKKTHAHEEPHVD